MTLSTSEPSQPPQGGADIIIRPAERGDVAAIVALRVDRQKLNNT